MYNEKFRFIEKMQLILLTCIGGALLVAPKHYISTEDFKGKIEKRPGMKLIIPSHSQVDLGTRHYSLAQILWKRLIFNGKEPDFINSTLKTSTKPKLSMTV